MGNLIIPKKHSYFQPLMYLLVADEIPKEDCQKMFEELAPKEDEDGMIPYTVFIDKLCGKA